MNTSYKPYGTYERVQYNTAPLPAVDWAGLAGGALTLLRNLALALALVAVIVAGMALAYVVASALVASVVMLAKLGVVGLGCYAAWRMATLEVERQPALVGVA